MADIEQTAREMGWKPREEFRGDDTKWVDAQTFVSRGENFLPILRADNSRLKDELTGTRAEVLTLKQTLAAAQEAIEELKTFGIEQTKRQVEQARKDLIAQLKSAREAGDVEAEVAAQEGLDELRDAKAASPAAAPAPKPAAAPAVSDESQIQFQREANAWIEAHPWFKTDPRKRGLTMGIIEELREKHKDLVGKPFFDKLSEEVEAALNPRTPSKVAGGGGGGGGSGGGGGKSGRTYEDLPAEAKAACDAQAKKLVGPGRAFKDTAAQRAHYVTHFFAGETA